MYKLKNAARRGTALVGAISLLAGIGTSALPVLVHADALNPLTERSLLLSSSSPGWSYTDGSNNPTYAPPNSGANGQKTGESFTFRVSSNATVKGFTFQFCTTAAGYCQSPGNDSGGTPNSGPAVPRGSDDSSHSDLNVTLDSTTHTPAEVSTLALGSDGIPNRNQTEGNFAVEVPASLGVNGTANTLSTGWTMTAVNQESNDGTSGAIQTGKNNYIKLVNSGGQALQPGDQVKVTFFATDYNYITNPGDSAFFVKINDYNSDTTLDTAHLVDGGVTVANIMNQSIQIQTKVLETMDFSVGTIDPDTLTAATLGHAHGQCDSILTHNPANPTDPQNSLFLGNTSAENSLETANPYATHSYWRLSSNSSGGATVYYSGNTLSNTEADQISPIGDTAQVPNAGTEQFGLAIAHGSQTDAFYGGADVMPVDTTTDSRDNGVDNGGALDSGFSTYVTTTANKDKAHNPQLYPLVPTTAYGGGAGTITTGGTSQYAFNAQANTIPVPIASENTQVVNCATAKMRYIGDIAATTPAGIYTTKINYLAAPQY